jgi:hypothetical protein
MNLNRGLTLLATLLALVPAAAQAKDEQRLFDIAVVLASPEGHDRFDDTIRFYWSGQMAPTPLETVKIHTSERKTFSPTRTEQEACDQSFIEALAALRDAAREVGANAVVEIKSLYKNREFRSTTQYECRLGYFAAGVTLEGTLVKLPAP